MSEEFDFEEFVICARYGELDDMKAMMQNYLESHPDANICNLASKKNAYGSTALHMAAANSHLDIMEYLINDCMFTKKELEIKNEEGNTPLHWAALNGFFDGVKLLITAGASGNVKNNADKEPGYYAELKGHQDIVNYILRTIPTEVIDNTLDNNAEITQTKTKSGATKISLKKI
ncbi:hypothetical protein BCR36DRAFT_579765 [Piromyces finnis]|uniref:Uncharacterized protein n=1 Tax=Piromyces finnis TaxID=1754191 RepID=A0A1Y1VLW2_9FUNG|nr:hypothetical protein BCR36DRAFT_579765 [Piromyces finnis]|eukprot:ORX59135.1 hypothetical protein BCR36DRAFT_579765 [Piromyces finnis]